MHDNKTSEAVMKVLFSFINLGCTSSKLKLIFNLLNHWLE